MKRKLFLLAPAAALAFLASCATAPKAPAPEAAPVEQPAPQAAPAAQPATPAEPNPESELTQARSLQKRIDDLGLSPYDPDTYAAGTKDLAAGQDQYGKDNVSAKASLTSAISEFNAVLANGGPLYLADARQKADASRKAADDLKASVAVKDDYGKALAVYQSAVQEKDAGDLENAGRDFAAAQAQFDAVAKTAQAKKDAAVQAMQDAQKDQSASEQKAADAQKALQDEGITVPAAAQ